MSGIIQELKRRKVFRVAGVYAVVAWALIEVADVVFPRLALPDWTVTFVVVLAILGFPIAIILAWAFDVTPDGVQRTPREESRAAGSTRPTTALYARRGTWFTVGILVTLTTAWVLVDSDPPAGPSAVNRGTVAVLPFRTAGAAPELAYLREGMVDLLATKLTGEAGPRAMDPRRVIAAWRSRLPSAADDMALDPALALATGLEAEQLLTGTVVGTGEHIILTGSLHDVVSGRERAQATVEGAPDSLTALVDRLAGTLLALEAGADRSDLASYTSHSLPALQTYLRGQAAYRAGRYDDACEEFGRALDRDSTFALAALGLSLSAGWLPSCNGEEAIRIAWTYRDRLSPRDRAVNLAWVGSRYPEPASAADRTESWRRAVEAMPDRADVWFWLADDIYHHGALQGMEDWRERSAEHFRRALALDSTNADNYVHLVPLLFTLGRDTEAIRLGERFLQRDSAGGGTADFLRWRIALARGDTAALARVREGLDSVPGAGIIFIWGTSVFEGVGVEDGQRILERWGRYAATPTDRRVYLMSAYIHEVVRGRPEAAAPIGRELAAAVTDSDWPDHVRVFSALYGDGDETDATAAVLELTRRAEAAPEEEPDARVAQLHDLCTVTQWRLWRGEPTDVGRVTGALRAATIPGFRQSGAACAALLEAIEAAVHELPSAAVRAAALDSLLETGPAPWFQGQSAVPNLAAARIHVRNGDPARALAAARRRPYFGPNAHLLLAASLELQGDLAARVGRRDEAIEAYRHYLALRSNPEPALEAEVERVRDALAALAAREGT